MLIKPTICNSDKLFVESLLVSPGLIPSDKQDGLPLGVESKGNTPNFVIPSEAHLFHVCVLRSLQGINCRSAQIMPELA